MTKKGQKVQPDLEPTATVGHKDKPLGEWPDSEKHKAAQSPQEEGEQSRSGLMPDPEEVTEDDTLEAAHKVGLHTEADEEHPDELDIDKELDELEEENK